MKPSTITLPLSKLGQCHCSDGSYLWCKETDMQQPYLCMMPKEITCFLNLKALFHPRWQTGLFFHPEVCRSRGTLYALSWTLPHHTQIEQCLSDQMVLEERSYSLMLFFLLLWLLSLSETTGNKIWWMLHTKEMEYDDTTICCIHISSFEEITCNIGYRKFFLLLWYLCFQMNNESYEQVFTLHKHDSIQISGNIMLIKQKY